MLKRNLIEKALNLLPDKIFTCNSCNKDFSVKRGDIRISQKRYNGPFCPFCGWGRKHES